MRFADALDATIAVPAENLDGLAAKIPVAWLEEALQCAGVATVRKRRLAVQQVIWLVLGMALMRNRKIEDVVDKLDLALPARTGKPMAQSSISDARQRLGADAVEYLFSRSAGHWAGELDPKFLWRGLSLYGVDGTTMAVADTPVNREYFGGQDSGVNKIPSGYPIVRIVALVNLRSRLLADARIGPYATTSELSLTDDLLDSVPDNTLFISDRNFLTFRVLRPLLTKGSNRHFLMRAKKTTAMDPIESLGKNDSLVELPISAKARKEDPTLGKTWIARAIRYQVPGHDPQFLLTSLLNPKTHPAAELIGLYHERWDLEIGFAEVKTTTLEQRPALRSKLPTTTLQEVWGILLAYNLVRLEMAALAEEADVMPNRISYIAALHLIRDEWLWSALTSPGALPARMRDLRASLSHYILRPRRPERVYPRAVKNRTKPYPARKSSAAKSKSAAGEA